MTVSLPAPPLTMMGTETRLALRSTVSPLLSPETMMELKLELADAMMSGFPRKQSVRHRLEHVWNGYVEWGVANPEQQRVLKQIQVWGGLTEESKKAGMAPFAEFQRMAEDALTQRIYKDLPQAFIGAALAALADMTMEFMGREPEKTEMYRTAGFEMLWAGITRR